MNIDSPGSLVNRLLFRFIFQGLSIRVIASHDYHPCKIYPFGPFAHPLLGNRLALRYRSREPIRGRPLFFYGSDSRVRSKRKPRALLLRPLFRRADLSDAFNFLRGREVELDRASNFLLFRFLVFFVPAVSVSSQ